MEFEQALQALKDTLSSAPVLAYPDGSDDVGEFIIDTYASDYHIGGVLSQIQDAEEKVIIYFSKGFWISAELVYYQEGDLCSGIYGNTSFQHICW